MLKPPLSSDIFPSLDENPNPWAGLITSLDQENEYICELEGNLPLDIKGTLYRLGPGLYDRGPHRKRMVLDGDGMIQEFSFQDGKVRYRNRFIETSKYLKEKKANKFIYPTLSTHGAGSWMNNLGISLAHQANITPMLWNNRLYCFDEGQKPYRLDPETLATMGEEALDSMNPKLKFWAHWKLDSLHKRLHCIAVDQGPKITAHVVSLDPSGKVLERNHFPLPRACYFHDWFLSENYFGFLLHPAIVSLKTLFRVSLGLDTFSDALKWNPKLSNIVVLYNRKTGEEYKFEAPARWMWHSVNTYEEGNKVIADFIGNQEGGGLGDSNSPLFEIMKNISPTIPKQSTNHLVRYEMNLKTRELKEQTLSDEFNFELPSVSATQRSTQYDHGYFIAARPGEFFAHGLGQWNQKQQKLESYFFSGPQYCGEPLPLDHLDTEPSPWLASLIYDGSRKKSFLGVFRREKVSEGPVCKAWLKHHSPLGFHGFWSPQIFA